MVGYDYDGVERTKSPRSMNAYAKSGKGFDSNDDEAHSGRSSTDSGFLNNSDNKSQQAGIDIAKKHKKMWELLGTYIGHDKESIQK